MRPLIDAYFNAIYEVHTNPVRRLTFARTPIAAPTSRRPFSEPWAIITAFNPDSRPLSDAENTARDLALHARLIGLGLASIRTRSSDTQGRWPEQGWLVYPITRRDILAIAREFGQRAVVFSTNHKAGLLFTASERWLIRPVVVSPDAPRSVSISHF